MKFANRDFEQMKEVFTYDMPPFPKSNKGVVIIAKDLEAHFRNGKSLDEIAVIYGMKRKSLQSKIRNSLSLSEAMERGQKIG